MSAGAQLVEGLGETKECHTQALGRLRSAVRWGGAWGGWGHQLKRSKRCGAQALVPGRSCSAQPWPGSCQPRGSTPYFSRIQRSRRMYTLFSAGRAEQGMQEFCELAGKIQKNQVQTCL